jgi:hypothetical protein
LGGKLVFGAAAGMSPHAEEDGFCCEDEMVPNIDDNPEVLLAECGEELLVPPDGIRAVADEVDAAENEFRCTDESTEGGAAVEVPPASPVALYAFRRRLFMRSSLFFLAISSREIEFTT